ncbi:hypothetical protein M431DRAFT_502745 [Trichoderma harzianum CBS 226.95]|uniref:Uncharacterized protein n=1 Tax=Trichoderma harzianum CBS 226.95 TaxID=983964 RepID=A0A2T4AU67_TRIHA|nr:hypothetical protein M431DRAFT_502745 [Trichoderma harzianum CBS 226.95]PTB60614.1 hypothetical protein M431DRAFT_502745 [Trichoderma harzianum CBS 226.95]
MSLPPLDAACGFCVAWAVFSFSLLVPWSMIVWRFGPQAIEIDHLDLDLLVLQSTRITPTANKENSRIAI